MHNNDPLLEVQDLKTYFTLRGSLLRRHAKYVRAVDGVSITVGTGETVAVVGESGCGKTTLARTILLLAHPTAGSIELFGQKGIRSNEYYRNVQMVFQDPDSSLDPKMKIRDIVAEPLTGLSSLSKQEIKAKVTKVIMEMGLGSEILDRMPRQLSGGQKQRVNIARAIVSDPKLLILDEPTSALDASVQAQILNLLLDLQNIHGLSYLIITHNIAVAEYLSDRICVMYAGRIVEQGLTEEVIQKPRHPYTLALLASAPVPDPNKRNLPSLEIVGEPPSSITPPPGCRFHPRCPYAEEICRTKEPSLDPLTKSRLVACHFVSKTA
jgi:oligopeptide/dipeptide ABC transporter ATP-binding protein